MKRICSTVLMVLVTTAVAQAADLANRFPTKAPVAVVAESWTGFYLGGELGGRWANTTWTSTGLQDPIDPATSARFLPQGNPASFDSTSFRAGGYAGYNWQLSPVWLVGIEGDAAWADNNRTRPGIPGTWLPIQNGSPIIANDSSTVKLGWDASIRGRAGVLLTPSLLLFGSGGVAWQQVSLTANCNVTGPWCFPSMAENFDKVATGYVVGGGIESKFGRWLARLEYRYADFGRIQHEFFPPGPATFNAVFMNESVRTHTVSAGLAYSFGSP
jgi:outer membrane immunogenic protein